MLDIRLIREKPDFVRERLATRGNNFASQVDEVLTTDSDRRRVETEVQKLNAERNKLSKDVGALRAQGKPSSQLEVRVRTIGTEIDELNQQLTASAERLRSQLLLLPNLPHPNIPLGSDASANPVIRESGDKPAFAYPAKDHVELLNQLGLVDFERAAKITGSGFLCFTGTGARLQRGLTQFLLDLHTTKHGYREVSTPYLVRRDCMIGTGQLPKFEEDAYGLENNAMFLIPTAEVPVTNLHREEVLSWEELPKRYVASSPCFRREAGSAGKTTRGMIRVHQFEKVELVKVTTPESSYDELEKLTADAEEVLQLLGLHYRVIELCSGDISPVMAKTYDIEVWAPGQQQYLEVSSCSNAEDYQARRMNLRFKDKEGKNRFCHTLNGSGTALPRLYVALVESYQQPDGSIRLPEALWEYAGMKEIR
jgi:seryl-tRNA synthetase